MAKAKMHHIPMTGSGDVRGTRVANPQVYEDVARRPRGDLVAPVISYILAFSSTVIFQFGEELDPAYVPAPSAFDIQTGGAGNTVTAVAVNGSAVILTITTALTSNTTAVTGAYTKPTANTRLRDRDGNEVASFTATTGRNLTSPAADATAPTLGLAICNGSSLRLFFDESLDTGSVPAVGDFAVVVAGGADVVTALAVNGSVVRLTLTTAATNGQAVTVAYTKPGSGMLQDLTGNDVASFGATAAVNDTPVYSGEIVYKQNNESITNSTALQADDELVTVNTDGPGTFDFEAVLWFLAGAGNLRFQLNTEASTKIVYINVARKAIGDDVVTLYEESFTDSSTIISVQGNSGANQNCIHIRGRINVIGSDSISLWWAQNTVNAAATSILKGSWMRATRVAGY